MVGRCIKLGNLPAYRGHPLERFKVDSAAAATAAAPQGRQRPCGCGSCGLVAAGKEILIVTKKSGKFRKNLVISIKINKARQSMTFGMFRRPMHYLLSIRTLWCAIYQQRCLLGDSIILSGDHLPMISRIVEAEKISI